MSFRCKREELRKDLNPSEEIIFAEQFSAGGNTCEPIRKYLDDARKHAGISKKETNAICNVKNVVSRHYFDYTQWMLPTEEPCNIIKRHMHLKPYEEIKKNMKK